MRDRALVGVRPYLQPIDALLERLRPYAIVVVERGTSTFFRTQLGRVTPWGVIEEEALRKANYGGFGGYEERRTRAHADTLAQRHYRETAERLRTQLDAGRYDLLSIGGSAEHIEGLVAQLAPPVVERLPQPVELLIWRKGHSPHFRSLAKIESAAIACVCSGDTLDAIGAALEKDFPDADVATEFGIMLHRWLDDGIISIGPQSAEVDSVQQAVKPG